MNIAKDHFEKDYLKKSSDDNRIFRMEYGVSVPHGIRRKCSAWNTA